MSDRNQNNNYNKFNNEFDINKRDSKAGKIIKRILLGLLFVFVAFVLVVGIKFTYMFYKYNSEASKMVSDAGEKIFKSNLTSTIYDCNGEVIAELKGAHDAYYLEYSEIPYFAKCALIATEDRNFYKHSGVDYKAVVRAFVVLVQEKGEITQGGSTITQQLARNVFLSHQVTVDRKVQEMFIAKELERQYTKDEILEFYVNNIYFGNGFYGIEAAARGYFSKSATELSLAEIAYICAIPNNPNMYDPYINGEATVERKNRILKQMYELDYIDKEMYQDALFSTIVLVPSETKKNNYVETYVRFCATESLMKNAGFEFKYYFDSVEEKEKYEKEYEALYTDISNKLYTGGYKIYTSIDLQVQENLQQTLDDKLSSYTEVNDEGIYKFQGSATCIDNNTGKVVAIVGGRSQQYNGYTLNRAYQSYRQPGSTIKPILDYLPALERGYTSDTIVTDEKAENGPVNSNGVYEGDITLRTAVEKSKNTVAWNIFEEIGIDTCILYLKNMNFKKIVEKDYVPAMSIGGMTYGVSSLEMAAAYATIENEGVYRTPTCINKITDTEDRIIINNNSENSKTSTVESKHIYEKSATRMMNDILKGVLTKGTGISYNITSAICAAKTGTTNDIKDVWFVGYSTYYTTAVWAGYDYPQVIDTDVGKKIPGTIWQEFMQELHIGLPTIDFLPYIDLSKGEEETEESTSNNSGEDIEESTDVENTDNGTAENSSGNSSGNTAGNWGGNAGENNSQVIPDGEIEIYTEPYSEEYITENEENTGEIYTEENVEVYTEENTETTTSTSGIYQEYWG